jgi:hypothetical protein
MYAQTQQKGEELCNGCAGSRPRIILGLIGPPDSSFDGAGAKQSGDAKVGRNEKEQTECRPQSTDITW